MFIYLKEKTNRDMITIFLENEDFPTACEV